MFTAEPTITVSNIMFDLHVKHMHIALVALKLIAEVIYQGVCVQPYLHHFCCEDSHHPPRYFLQFTQ